MSETNELYHYGTKRHSGRYPYGSGEDPYQHEPSHFLNQVKQLKKEGYTESQIAEKLLGEGKKSTHLRAEIAMKTNEKRAADRARAVRLKAHGYSNTEIGRRMGINESSVRNLLAPSMEYKASKIETVANVLKDQVDQKKYLDITAGSELQFDALTDGEGKPISLGADQILNVSQTSLKNSVAYLEKQGYKTHYLQVEQASNPGKKTTVKVLTKGDVPWSEVNNNRDKILSPGGVYIDTGNSVCSIRPPVSIDSKRIEVNYAEDGGSKKDGVIELRRGVADLSMGQNQYAQVRIAVDGNRYLKGMAMYSDDLPPGIDIRFNTNKTKDIPKLETLKKIKDDPDNPFGAVVRQFDYEDANGNKHQSPINIVNDDSDWGHWSKNLSSQMLSKQSPQLAKRQLGIAYSAKQQEFDEICSIPNPTIKRALLAQFADSCDSDAIHLKAAAMPRQETKVILPLTKIKDNEVYAPTFKHGESVALVRYPHGGIFEIPVLKVNNRNKEGESRLKQAPNAIGINSNVAARLSGADFDGDTVIVIPLKGQDLKTSKPLAELQGFDPSERYPNLDHPKVKNGVNFNKQMEMGKVSNLITDMTLQGADHSEIARAVKHSMVVIDAEKHNLDWKQSEADYGIKALKEKYQGGKNKGAATLISKATSRQDVPERKDRFTIDPLTGEKTYLETGATQQVLKNKAMKKEYKALRDAGYSYNEAKAKLGLTDADYKHIPITQESTKMAEAKTPEEVYSLSSGTLMESVYANHAIKLKALGNAARKEYISTKNLERDPAAAKLYSAEVASLNSKLNIALKNAPRERQAQLMASKVIFEKKNQDPSYFADPDHESKIRRQAISEARARSGSISRGNMKKGVQGRAIYISDKEWEAIQAGAISSTKLSKILDNSDMDEIKRRAMPRENRALDASKYARAKALAANGYSQAEIAEAVGMSVATLKKHNVF